MKNKTNNITLFTAGLDQVNFRFYTISEILILDIPIKKLSECLIIAS